MRILLLSVIMVIGLAACGKRQAADIAHAAATSYNTPYRDSVIKNWQAKVADIPRCSYFKDKFRIMDMRYDSAASGAFQIDMMKTRDEAKAASCQYSPS